jgi:hypothetical protein
MPRWIEQRLTRERIQSFASTFRNNPRYQRGRAAVVKPAHAWLHDEGPKQPPTGKLRLQPNGNSVQRANSFPFARYRDNAFQFLAKSLLAPRNFVTPLSSGAMEPSFHDARDNRCWWMDRLMAAVSRLR